MRPLAPALLIALAMTAPAAAQLPAAQIDTVRVDAKTGAGFPLSLRFADIHGRQRSLGEVIGDSPAIIVFADYTCSNLCGPILAFAAAGLAKSGLKPGRDFRLVVIGLDPKDGPREALEMKRTRVGSDTPLAKSAVFLIGNAASLKTATQAAGYHYVYDKKQDQFAHPAAVYVTAHDGRIVRVLSGLGLTGDSLRLALVDAGQGRVGTLLDQIRLRCFGFDPARGIYTASITRILTIACCVTVLILFGGVGFLVLAWRRKAREAVS
jgi:protein SCO1/2